jgi:hypothetical protein
LKRISLSGKSEGEVALNGELAVDVSLQLQLDKSLVTVTVTVTGYLF